MTVRIWMYLKSPNCVVKNGYNGNFCHVHFIIIKKTIILVNLSGNCKHWRSSSVSLYENIKLLQLSERPSSRATRCYVRRDMFCFLLPSLTAGSTPQISRHMQAFLTVNLYVTGSYLGHSFPGFRNYCPSSGRKKDSPACSLPVTATKAKLPPQPFSGRSNSDCSYKPIIPFKWHVTAD